MFLDCSVSSGVGATPAATEASAGTAIADQAELAAIAADPQWLRLLHYNETRHTSEILSEDFFLAPDGNVSPQRELEATIRAYAEPRGKNEDEHPRCRFPARYLWLSQRLNLAGGGTAEIRCPSLEGWAKFAALQSVSLMMVSGYFGNPASSFGHIIIRLNNGEDRSPHGLLDLGINYGALVPPNELTLVYIAKGLFGGYEAGFSDKLYYSQDLVYSRTEFRDMWEYELALSDPQLRLFVYHLWEIAGKKYRYYFLKENCAYRVAELLEMVTGRDFVGDVDAWYAPVEVFHRLREIDASEDGRLIRGVRFVPSSQRVLYAEFARLSRGEAEAANRVIARRDPDAGGVLANFPPERRLAILDAVLAYYEYRSAGDGEEFRERLRRAKDAVLLARLRLPPSASAEEARIEQLEPPSAGSKPSTLGLGVGYNDKLGKFTRVRYAAFTYDVIGNNNLDGSELVVFDLAAGVSAKQGAFLDRFDAIRVRKNNLNTTRIRGEARLSWQAGLGVKREENDCTDCLEGFATGGIGRAARLAGGTIGYVFVNTSLESGRSAFVAGPEAGLVFKRGGRWAAWGRAIYEYDPIHAEGRETYRVDARYSISTNHEIRLEFEGARATSLVLSFRLYR